MQSWHQWQGCAVQTVTVKIDRQQQLGTASCSECRQMYQVDNCSALHEAVDVYAEWIDALEEANA